MDSLGLLFFGLLIVLVTIFLDPASAIGGSVVGVLARQDFFGRSWPMFLGGIVVAVGLAQAASFLRLPAYVPSFESVFAGSLICLACALVFGAKVFKLTGNAPAGGGMR